MRRRYGEHRQFLALRACWSILRGESVAWKLNFTSSNGTFESVDRGLFVSDCTVDGKPFTHEHLYHANPEGQQQ